MTTRGGSDETAPPVEAGAPAATPGSEDIASAEPEPDPSTESSGDSDTGFETEGDETLYQAVPEQSCESVAARGVAYAAIVCTAGGASEPGVEYQQFSTTDDMYAVFNDLYETNDSATATDCPDGQEEL